RLVSRARPRKPVAIEPPQTERSLPPSHRLPRPLTELVGREEEIAQIGARLRQRRLVTLTGTGGIGKTRLAIATAESVVEEYPDGVWFVELAALSEPRLVVQAVASTVGVREEPGRSLEETLTASLKPRLLL